jgi:hypothetical protein
MRRHPPAFFTLLLIGSLASTAAPAQRRFAAVAEQQAAREARARERAQRDLLRDLDGGRITLPEAARLAGGTLVIDRRPVLECFPQLNVRGLVDHSSLVIAGRPFVARVELTNDRRSIVTTYSVQVDDTFKTRQLAPLLRHVIVRVPGGRMDFGDGTSADILSGPPLAPGERYVLFLQNDRNTSSAMPGALSGTSAATSQRDADGPAVIYTPLGVDEGVFHLRAGRATRSHAHDTSSRLRRHDGISEAIFLAEVKAAAATPRFCIACSSSQRARF